MIQKKEYPLEEIKFLVKKAEEKTEEIKKYSEETEKLKYEREEKQIIEKRLDALKKELKNMVSKFPELLQKLDETGKTLIKEEQEKKIQTAEDEHYFFQESPFKSEGGNVYKIKELKKEELERETFRRLKLDKKRKEEENKKKSNKKDKNNLYSEISSKFFSKFSKKLLGNESFKKLEKDLIRANLDYAPTGYISIILFTTILSIFIGGFIFMFFLFFKIEATLPFIVRSGQDILTRFSKVVWILILAPIGTFLMMYIYPSLEKKAAETRINVELPFAAIHMAAISGSMINPVKIFEIIISTKEYPAIEKEFTKILNDINIYGSDLVSALKNGAKNTPSKKLSELLNGLATLINSGGDLPKFFDKRSQTLLFEYKLAREKAAKAAETFMDIYISLVIAAPMILMLLLMMMKISGLGLNMSVSAITLMMTLGVTLINLVFITFLHLKRTE